MVDIELADAVAAVRDDLLDAARRGQEQQVAFMVGPIELEFTVELRKDAKAKMGFKAWVLSADLEGGLSQGRAHRVRVTLTPKTPDGGDLLISADPVSPREPDSMPEHYGR